MLPDQLVGRLDWAVPSSAPFAVTIKVPNSTSALFLATYSGQLNDGGDCQIRVLMNQN